MTEERATVDGVLTALQLRIDMVEPEEAERIAEEEIRLIEIRAESDDKWRASHL